MKPRNLAPVGFIAGAAGMLAWAWWRQWPDMHPGPEPHAEPQWTIPGIIERDPWPVQPGPVTPPHPQRMSAEDLRDRARHYAEQATYARLTISPPESEPVIARRVTAVAGIGVPGTPIRIVGPDGVAECTVPESGRWELDVHHVGTPWRITTQVT